MKARKCKKCHHQVVVLKGGGAGCQVDPFGPNITRPSNFHCVGETDSVAAATDDDKVFGLMSRQHQSAPNRQQLNNLPLSSSSMVPSHRIEEREDGCTPPAHLSEPTANIYTAAVDRNSHKRLTQRELSSEQEVNGVK